MAELNAKRIDLDFTHTRKSAPVHLVDLSLTHTRKSAPAQLVDLGFTSRAAQKLGYIGGREDGIVTLKDNPVRREILVLDGQTRQVVKRIYSLPSGHYLADDLDPNGEYLILARPTREEGIDGMVPPAWDYVKPAVDLSISEQYQLWQTWQTE